VRGRISLLSAKACCRCGKKRLDFNIDCRHGEGGGKESRKEENKDQLESSLCRECNRCIHLREKRKVHL
jgi:hypothetical protein